MLQRVEDSFDDIDLILNPHVYAIENTLREIHSTDSVEHKNELIEELTVVFTKDDILYNKKIQLQFPNLLDLLRNDGLYDNACILLSDIVRHKPVIQKIFYLLKIFDLLKFTKYKSTTSLVFSMCYGNKELTNIFFNKYYVEERDNGNEMINILKDQK
jgi:hypothetical protein